ncbi:CU044_2847 family protein [Nonomuraea sp. LP-02]|uniref:CU044_2847 family protein n=1 Tax=Nonomuraea sp. LP-02 TaxID=3097960 RepID=UPI002E300293|nr:CU044_2847 family protein [Nonomuraea sp. LP-02]MED7929248.1 CU044_2847 family protein [Nonomuraea sp. LP-02]
MADVVRIPLEGGGVVLVEATGSPGGSTGGPVKAGRVDEAVRSLPTTLQAALGPITDGARAVLSQLRKAGPDEIEIEFGVDLSTEAGAVITKTAASCHLRVTVVWKNGKQDSEHGPNGN